MLNPASAVARLLLQLADGRLLRLLVLIDQAAGQLPSPPVLNEAVAPQHQNPFLVIHQHHHRGPGQPHDVMPEPLTIRHLHVDLTEPDPWVVVDCSLTKGPPPAPLTVLCISHPPTLAPWTP